jgi:hypothetical protein
MLLQVLRHLVAVDLYSISVMADGTLFTRTGLGGALRHDRLHCRTEEEKGNEDKQRRKQFPGDWIHNEKRDAKLLGSVKCFVKKLAESAYSGICHRLKQAELSISWAVPANGSSGRIRTYDQSV